MPSVSTCPDRSRAGAGPGWSPAVPKAAPGAVVALLAALIAVAAPGAAARAGGQAASAAGTFRSQTDLVALQVSVVDQAGRPVPGLDVDAFAIFDEGARQPISVFATSMAPLDLMLLFDVSGSMGQRMAAARDAAIDLVQTLRPGDRAALVLFNDRVRMAQALTGDRALLEAAIRGASPAGGTALHDAIYIALRELARVKDPGSGIRRQALIVLSDGADTTSRSVTQPDVVDVARRGAVTIFTIMPAPEVDMDPVERLARGGPAAEFNLRTLARETGGRAFTPARWEDLSATYSQIAEELSQQYWLAYVAPAAGGGFRRVSVQVVARPGLRVRTRSGYFATAPRRGDAALRQPVPAP